MVVVHGRAGNRSRWQADRGIGPRRGRLSQRQRVRLGQRRDRSVRPRLGKGPADRVAPPLAAGRSRQSRVSCVAGRPLSGGVHAARCRAPHLLPRVGAPQSAGVGTGGDVRNAGRFSEPAARQQRHVLEPVPSETTNVEINAWDLTKVFAGDANNVAWVIDLELDGQQRPYVVFSVQKDGRGLPRGQGGMDHRFDYGRWDGSAWRVHEMAYTGRRLYAGEDDYTGLAALDPRNPNVVYISTDADPVTGAPLVSRADGQRHRELYRGTTGDFGATGPRSSRAYVLSWCVRAAPDTRPSCARRRETCGEQCYAAWRSQRWRAPERGGDRPRQPAPRLKTTSSRWATAPSHGARSRARCRPTSRPRPTRASRASRPCSRATSPDWRSSRRGAASRCGFAASE